MDEAYARDFRRGYQDGSTDAGMGLCDPYASRAAPGYRDGYQRGQAEVSEPYAGEMQAAQES